MSESVIKQLHVLALGDAYDAGGWGEWLDHHAKVEHVGTLDEALKVLSDHPIDLVFSRAQDFPLFHETVLAEQAGYTPMGKSQGVCVVDSAGRVVWSNSFIDKLPQELRDKVRACCEDAFASYVGKSAEEAARIADPGRRELLDDKGRTYELSMTPVIATEGIVSAVAAVVREATQVRRLQHRIEAIDRAGRELVRLDAEQISRLDVHERLSLLEQKIVRYTRDLLHFDNFTIFVIDKKTNKLELVLASGMPSEVKAIDLYAYAEGNGISGYVAATGNSYICPDVSKDTRYLPGLSDARSSLTVPLRLNDQLVGIFNVESERTDGFTEEDRQFAQIFGRNIAIALHILELLLTERHTTTGRLGRDIRAEVTGPLNDVLTEIETLVEDYLGMDDLRHRLRSLSDHVVGVRSALKQATSPGSGLLVARTPRAARIDPILRGKKVLIVDDEDMIRETVRDVLAGYGCNVDTASDGNDAIALIQDHPYDLVLSDIKLPVKNGYEVFAAAKAANPKTPVILMTGFGYDPNHAIVRANRDGLAAVLFKPFKVDQLLGEIRTALRALNA